MKDKFTKRRFKKLIIFGYLVLCAPLAEAQLCQGSLGDPIIDLDFGSGTSVHGSPLPAGMTSYTWSSNDFPIDGSYTIENTTVGSGLIWWPTTDHTGNSGGYMMVVNASISKTDYFYKNTVSGICPGTTYEFAAWIINLLRTQDLSPPNITFMIEKLDGTLINSYTTGPIALQTSALWRQFGFYFTTPAGVTEVTIVMRNNSAGGAPANDLALDDITFRPCGPTVTASIESALADTLCQGSARLFHFQGTESTGYNSPQYQWQELVNGIWQDISGATDLNFTQSFETYQPGTYQFRLASSEGGNITSVQCRVLSNLVTVVVLQQSSAKYEISNPVVCGNIPIQFIDSTQILGNVTYKWDFGDGTTSTAKDPSHLYSQSGIYNTSMILSSQYGCADTATLTINVQMLPIPLAKFNVHPTDTTILHPTINFTDESSGGTSCRFDWGDGIVTDCNTTSHDYTREGTFIVKEIVENSSGCYDTAYTTVYIRAEFAIAIPNAFSPNGDGQNDIFMPKLYGVHNYSLRVYNRWGQQLFETNDPEQGWNGEFKGTLCTQGTYVYSISFYDDVENKLKVYSGSFILL